MTTCCGRASRTVTIYFQAGWSHAERLSNSCSVRFDWHNTSVCNPSVSSEISSISETPCDQANSFAPVIWSTRRPARSQITDCENKVKDNTPCFTSSLRRDNSFRKYIRWDLVTGSFGEPDARASIIRRYRRRKRVYAFYACTIALVIDPRGGFHFRVLRCQSRCISPARCPLAGH